MAKLPIPFGNPATYKGHSGVDYPGHAGEVIRASGPGSVVSRGRNDRGGFYVWIQYDNGPLVGYHHMNSHLGVPSLRDRVDIGSQLGFVGWSGRVVPPGRAGVHLHSEVSGHATTAGYWKFFDPNRVVGSGSSAGGGEVPPAPPTPSPVTNGDEMYIIRAEGRPATLVGPGYAHPLDQESAGNIGAIVSKDTTVNPRQFDLCVAAATSGTVSGARDGAIIMSSPNRKKALIAPGFVRELSVEEADNSATLFTNRSYVVNDRQYDLAVSIALTGRVPAVK